MVSGYVIGLLCCWIAGGYISRGDCLVMLLGLAFGPLMAIFIGPVLIARLASSDWGDKPVFGKRDG